MLAAVLNIPRTPQDWAQWSLHHSMQHDQIDQALARKTGQQLPLYQLDPIPFNDVPSWLERNQARHDNMNAPLKLEGVDLEGVDFNDIRQLEAWVWLEWQELRAASIALGI